MSTVTVKPELMRWARERAGLTLDDLAHSFPKYPQWEQGDSQPSLRQLENLAKKTLTPLGYFFLPNPPDDKLPIPDFRTLRDEPVRRPSPNLLETVYLMQRRQGWMRDYLIEQGEDPLPFVGSVTLEHDIVKVALKIRTALGLKDGWAKAFPTWTEALRELRLAVEKARILVSISGIFGNNTHRALDVDEFRGFVLSDPYAPLIFVNGADAKAAQMFTIAHELAHVWLGRGGVFNLPRLLPVALDVEMFCNRVAAEFLIPERDLHRYWPEAKRSPQPFEAVARHYKVSSLVAARRALDLGLIGKNAFFLFYSEYLEKDFKKKAKQQSGGDFYATQDMRLGRLFAGAVIRAAREGRLLYRDAYHLTGLYGTTFDRYAGNLATHE